jgi:hypothetical protein
MPVRREEGGASESGRSKRQTLGGGSESARHASASPAAFGSLAGFRLAPRVAALRFSANVDIGGRQQWQFRFVLHSRTLFRAELD